VSLTTSLPSVSQLSRKCWRLDISEPYGPPPPVTGIALPFYLFIINAPFQLYIQKYGDLDIFPLFWHMFTPFSYSLLKRVN
jgi:hypothetical protein